MRYGKHLKQVRLARSMSQRQIAEFLGQSIAYISDVEHGRRFPWPLATQVRLAKFLESEPFPFVLLASVERGKFEFPTEGMPTMYLQDLALEAIKWEEQRAKENEE